MIKNFGVSQGGNFSLQIIDLSFLISNPIDQGNNFSILFLQLQLILFLKALLLFLAIAIKIRKVSYGMSIGDDSGYGTRRLLRISWDEGPSFTSIEGVHKKGMCE